MIWIDFLEMGIMNTRKTQKIVRRKKPPKHQLFRGSSKRKKMKFITRRIMSKIVLLRKALFSFSLKLEREKKRKKR
jgi:hypothetical protein